MKIDEKLALCYELMMQVARTGLFTPRAVRGGYTHWLGGEFAREIREFSGFASRNAASHGEVHGLVLEHYHRLQTSLTQLIGKHMAEGENVAEFIAEVKRLEKVHIVTKAENDLLRTKRIAGDYQKADIELLDWNDIPEAAKTYLRKKLRGKVANFEDYL